MAYEKQTWATGDIVTSSKLNHMEDGIAGAGGGIFMVEATGDPTSFTLGSTWQEVYDAADSGLVIVKLALGGEIIQMFADDIYEESGAYKVSLNNSQNTVGVTATTNSASGYPAYSSH